MISQQQKNIKLEDGKKLVRDAIAAGIFNDLGSGSNIDLCIITKQDVQYLRPYDEANLKGKRYLFPLWPWFDSILIAFLIWYFSKNF